MSHESYLMKRKQNFLFMNNLFRKKSQTSHHIIHILNNLFCWNLNIIFISWIISFLYRIFGWKTSLAKVLMWIFPKTIFYFDYIYSLYSSSSTSSPSSSSPSVSIRSTISMSSLSSSLSSPSSEVEPCPLLPC